MGIPLSLPRYGSSSRLVRISSWDREVYVDFSGYCRPCWFVTDADLIRTSIFWSEHASLINCIGSLYLQLNKYRRRVSTLRIALLKCRLKII